MTCPRPTAVYSNPRSIILTAPSAFLPSETNLGFRICRARLGQVDIGYGPFHRARMGVEAGNLAGARIIQCHNTAPQAQEPVNKVGTDKDAADLYYTLHPSLIPSNGREERITLNFQ